MKVVCISIRTFSPEQIQVGKEYIVDKDSIFRCDKEFYGTVYDGKKWVGTLNMNHFKEINEERG